MFRYNCICGRKFEDNEYNEEAGTYICAICGQKCPAGDKDDRR